MAQEEVAIQGYNFTVVLHQSLRRTRGKRKGNSEEQRGREGKGKEDSILHLTVTPGKSIKFN